MTYPDGSVYEGEWFMDQKGSYYKPEDGNEDPKPAKGHGKMTYPDGSVYEGEWKEDKREGQGKLTKSDGSVQEGLWVADQYSRPYKEDDGLKDARSKTQRFFNKW